MPNIKEIVEKQPIEEVLDEVSFTEPVFLSKDGKVKYVVLDSEDYRRMLASLKIVNQLG